HDVVVETQSGTRIGYDDAAYEAVGARIAMLPDDVYQSEMIIKVKEPQPSEYEFLTKGQILFTYLHLAPDPQQTEALLSKQVVGIAYETVTDDYGHLPLLVPMSEIAGRISIHAGANALHMIHGGRGVLLGGVPGVLPANVVVIGGGIVGTEAARMAMGLGAHVTILDTNLKRLRQLDAQYGPHLKTRYSTPHSLEECVLQADLVIGAVLIPGKSAPKLVSRDLVRRMLPGSVIVDVAIDQGGCIETSRPTTHSAPTYIVDDIVHYCVTNMPGACARTATEALTHATMQPAMAIAKKGWQKALFDDPHLRNGLNVCLGKVTNKGVAEDLGYDYVAPEECL
ncbi:MAG: alanine dehydrogenase, partial [Chlamydiia bacterium]|nr:alanine dehydrogenase [Chlamydiia bacterium]